MIFRVGRKTGSFFVRIVGAGDRLRNGLGQMMCFNCGWKESFRQFYGKMRRIFEQDEVVEIFE